MMLVVPQSKYNQYQYCIKELTEVANRANRSHDLVRKSRAAPGNDRIDAVIYTLWLLFKTGTVIRTSSKR